MSSITCSSSARPPPAGTTADIVGLTAFLSAWGLAWLCPQYGCSIFLQVMYPAQQVQEDPQAFFQVPSLEDALKNHLPEADSDGDTPTWPPPKKRKAEPINRCAAALHLAVIFLRHPV